MDSKAPGQQQPMQYTEKTVTAGGQEWNNGLFDCFSGADNLCLKATFCPCFVYGKTQHRIRDPSLAGYERFNQDCLMWCGVQSCCGLGWIFNWMARTELRNKFGINGGGCGDCMTAWCCTCCSIIQNEKEVIGRQSGAAAGGYVQQAGMVAQPQQY
ncbi:PLAC8-domain-containing protein [Mollisia scopiformis]|uniref:PLAC8-domain-containing protein n=1 Tax=Mollisia scopiformis TaxID=149040 RepID=A0A194XU89_MOLSC|nr:PLAC8-domain-containing protein [Mollisia scopiformis]KUJ23885.1 PLAC8-domain-containing protein [Mollisia scopiformis]